MVKIKSKASKDPKAQYFIFVLNNWTEEELQLLRDFSLEPKVQYIGWAQEIAGTGTPHLQGYIELEEPLRKTFKQMHKWTKVPRLSFEKRHGTSQQARDYYADNDEKPEVVGLEEYGKLSLSAPGKRNDLLALKETIDSGASLTQIADQHFGAFVRYERSIRSYKRLKLSPRDWQPEVIVLWGDTGTGKTRRAYESSDSPYFHPGGPWFDGYEGQEVVIFDDFSGSCFPIAYLLKLLDRYPMDVPIKGGFVKWTPKKIFITSNMNPKDWYSKALPEHVKAMERRFTHVEEFIDFTRERIPPQVQEQFKQFNKQPIE